MNITQDTTDAKYLITGYTDHCIVVNDEAHSQSFIISPDTFIAPWEVNDISQLNENNLAQVIQCQPEVVIIGSGKHFALPDPRIIAYFAQHKIGLDTMNTPAACRTYGVLLAEARRVAAAMIFTKS